MYFLVKVVFAILGGVGLFVLDRRLRKETTTTPVTPFVFLMMIFGSYAHDMAGLLVALVFGVLLNSVQLQYTKRCGKTRR
ncbi:MAG: hypothetical protein ABEJ55_02690 [Halanaeroarchaeum sp.]